MRSNRGSSTISAFSAHGQGWAFRCRLRGMKSSTRLTTRVDQWTIGNLRERLDALKSDPWAGYSKCRQRIIAAMRKRLDRSGKND
ncbi:hypothetical protein P3T25_008546 [Paraburkholderia sp. GAS32]